MYTLPSDAVIRYGSPMSETPFWPSFLSSRFTTTGPACVGGMGQVHRATCRLTDRDVAIKWLRTELTGEPGLLEHEYAVLSELAFPGVVPVWEWFRARDQSFLVTEWVDGSRLDTFLGEDPAPDAVMSVLYQLLVALSWVHSQGVIHGDIKPANILVVAESTGPRPVLIDFGLAYTTRPSSTQSASGGTKTFMAPELWSGQQRHPTPLSDLYALGLSFLNSSHRALPEPVRTLCTAMSHYHPMRRPASAAAALTQLHFSRSSDKNPFPTGRSLKALWSPWLEQLVPRGLQAGARLWISGVTDGCAPLLARRFGALLELSTVSHNSVDIRVIPSPGRTDPLRFYRRLAEWWGALAASDSAESPALPPPPFDPEFGSDEEFPELWRSAVDRCVEKLAFVLGRSALKPILIVPGLVGRSTAELTLLSQLLIAAPNLSVIVICEDQPGSQSGELISGASEHGFEISPQPVPDSAAIAAYVTQYGRGSVTDKALAILSERAKSGVDTVRAQMDVWLSNGALVPRIDGGVRFVDEKLRATQPGETTTTLWHSLWTRLSPRQQQTVWSLYGLGGVATLDEIVSLTQADASLIDQLTMAGWIDVWGAHSTIKLNSVVFQALPEWEPSPVTESVRNRWITVLRNRETKGAVEWLFLANHQQAAQDSDFLSSLSQAQRTYLLEGQPRLAGQIAVRVANEIYPKDPQNAHKEAVWATKAFVAAGANDLAEQTATMVKTWANPDPKLLEEAHLIAAGVALHAGKTELVQNQLQLFRAGRTSSGQRNDERYFRQSAEAALILGSALTLSGQLSAAAHELKDAKSQGLKGFSDPTTRAAQLFFGKLENSIGNLALQQGRWKDAAVAYRKSEDQKRALGDRRGERIARSNLAIALRESEDFLDAAQAATAAYQLAKSLGDLRGQAMGNLILAALAVDTAAIELAEAQLSMLDALQSSSTFVDLDTALCRVRLFLLENRFSAAKELAKETWTKAQTQGAALIENHAWGLLQAARFLDGDWAEWTDEESSNRGLPNDLSASPPEGWATADYLHLAVETFRAARNGRWDAARFTLDRQPKTPVGGEPGLRLFCEAAEIVGQGAAQRLVVARWRRDRSAQCLKLRSMVVQGIPWNCHPARFRVWTGAEGPLTAPGLPVAVRSIRTPPPVNDTPVPTQLKPQVDDSTTTTVADLPVPDLPEPPDDKLVTPAPAETFTLPAAVPAELPNTRDRVARWLEQYQTQHGATSVTLWAVNTDTLQLIFTSGAPDPAPAALLVNELQQQAPKPWIAQSNGQIERLLIPLFWDNVLSAILAMRFDAQPKPSAIPKVDTLVLMEPILAILGRLTAVSADNQRIRDRVAHLETDAKNQKASLLAEVSKLRDELHKSRLDSQLQKKWSKVVRRSAAMQKTVQTLDRVARSDLPVLLLGESGVGKELLAQLLHEHSDAASGPFVSENCGAIPSDLFESVFFGVQRGAFTGAVENKPGLVELAHGGTLFLDEIGDLRPDHQVKLLRVIQERRFRRVGGQTELTAHFRLICATNRDLGTEVAAGRFREDLYFRIAVVPVLIPPLRDRAEDIALLVAFFIEQQTTQTGKRWTVTREALNLLEQYPWPGNVRELENEVLRATVLAEGDRLEPRHFSDKLTAARTPTPKSTPATNVHLTWDGISTLQEHIDLAERAVIIEALEKAMGQKLKTAEMLGLSRPGLDAKLDRFGLLHLPKEIKSRNRSRS